MINNQKKLNRSNIIFTLLKVMCFYGIKKVTKVSKGSNDGRWLSRDPIEEKGGYNLYGMVRNNVIFLVDIKGESVTGTAVIATLLIVAACATPQYKDAHNKYKEEEGFSDKFRHCWVSCRIAKSCGALFAIVAGYMKESKDVAIKLKENDINPAWIDFIKDIEANSVCRPIESIVPFVGGWIGSCFRESCEDCCNREIRGKCKK